jgi:hypothetical protein
MVRSLKEFVDLLLNHKKPKPVPVVVYKTRTQIINEGRGSCICRYVRAKSIAPKE